MKKLFCFIKEKSNFNISYFSQCTLLAGLSSAIGIFLSIPVMFGNSAYISSAMISLGIRMIALALFASAITDCIARGTEKINDDNS